MNPKSIALLPEVIALVGELSSDLRLNLSVPVELNYPEKEILKIKNSLTSSESDKYTGLVSTLSDELNVSVSPKNVSRALRFMDTLIKALKNKRAYNRIKLLEYLRPSF